MAVSGGAAEHIGLLEIPFAVVVEQKHTVGLLPKENHYIEMAVFVEVVRDRFHRAGLFIQDVFLVLIAAEILEPGETAGEKSEHRKREIVFSIAIEIRD